ncbi:DinB family protein [Aquimarina sp. U1-2]|uniref:DinB family protein n=1 Tax=Aquimarina sp. U1-2 TaxID=2823141 RepID=UPI001AECD6BF|nr:DinB family protein [Aquimarina sp. U1-2]MBP2831520.1 DinB family protein [Aquimarina sp. U1-2]
MKILQSITAIITLLLSSCTPMTAQQSSFKKEYLKKLENSLRYSIKVAEAMPSEDFDFKPTADVRTFGEQLVHIGEAMAYIGKSAIKFDKIKSPKNANDKTAVITYLTAQFHSLHNAMTAKEATFFEETTSFWAGNMTRRNILEIVFTHTAHHRAQAIVHLRMKGKKPPEFIAW